MRDTRGWKRLQSMTCNLYAFQNSDLNDLESKKSFMLGGGNIIPVGPHPARKMLQFYHYNIIFYMNLTLKANVEAQCGPQTKIVACSGFM